MTIDLTEEQLLADRKRRREVGWCQLEVKDRYNKTGDRSIVAHYLLMLAKGSRAAGHQLTELELELERRAFLYLRKSSKRTDKTSKVLALGDVELLRVVSNARNKNVKLSKRILAAELAAFQRSKRI